jgi:transposase
VSTPSGPSWGVKTHKRISGVLLSILTEQLFAAKGWRVIAASRDEERRLVFQLEPTRAAARCSGCGETKHRIHDVKPARTWRHLDAWGLPTLVRAFVRRVRCRHCGVRIEQVPWARTRSRFTHEFEADVLRRARDTSILGVCRQLGLHWTSVMRLIERWIDEAAARHFRRPLKHIGVDEVSYGRGQHKFLTIVWDHDRSRVVWIGHGRDRDTLDAFFVKLGATRAHRLAAVTMDMAQGYIAAVRARAPQAAIVFDRFHIERYLTQAVDEVRRREFWRRGGAYREAVRGKRFLLLHKYRRVHWRRRGALAQLLLMNKRLFRTYVLKEQFEHAWTYTTARGMREFLVRWRRLLNWSRLTPLIRFWNMLWRHIDGVTAWAEYRLTNAAVESNNSRIRGLSQRARGYRNPTNLMAVIYHASWR